MNKYDIHKNERQARGLSSFAESAMPLIRNLLGKKGFVAADILTFWHQIVGEEMAEYTMPQKIDFRRGERSNGVLHLIVPSGAFALEVQHREKFVLQKVNSYFGYMAVAGLKIIQDSSFQKQLIAKINQQQTKKTLVTEQEQNYINELAEDIANPELQEKLVKLGKSVFNQNHK